MANVSCNNMERNGDAFQFGTTIPNNLAIKRMCTVVGIITHYFTAQLDPGLGVELSLHVCSIPTFWSAKITPKSIITPLHAISCSSHRELT